jgi:hypothetical protein
MYRDAAILSESYREEPVEKLAQVQAGDILFFVLRSIHDQYETAACHQSHPDNRLKTNPARYRESLEGSDERNDQKSR